MQTILEAVFSGQVKAIMATQILAANILKALHDPLALPFENLLTPNVLEDK